MLDAVLLNMIVVFGMVSKYNLTKPEGPQNLMEFVSKRLRMEGIMIYDYFPQYNRFLDVVLPLIREGKITYLEDIAEGLENAPAAFVGLYSGQNIGKQVVRVAEE